VSEKSLPAFSQDSLRISPGLSLPLEAATWVLSYLAKRGAGKTHNAAVQAEEMVKARIPIVVIDGMGIWWGLRVSADTKHPGLPVVVFGGDHQDLPLIPDKAADMAKAIVESNISCVLDLSGLSKRLSRRIVSDFLDELYKLNRVIRHVYIEEADLWAPQRTIGPEQDLCLSAVDNFVRRGGNHNLGVTLITQRSAVLNKDVLTQSDCLMILRTLAPQDKKAIQAWVEEQTDEDKTALNTWYDSLKSLKNGEAWVWHPEPPAIHERIMFRRRETFHATREFLLTPEASKITLMSVDEFLERFTKVFKAGPSTAKMAPGTLDPGLMKELEEFRNGNKLAETTQRRLKFLGDVKLDLEDKLKAHEDDLRLLDEFRGIMQRMIGSGPGPILKLTDEDIERIKKDLASMPISGPEAIVVTESIPEIHHQIERPIVQTNESNLEGRLITLALHGFFGEKRRSSAISAEITRVYAVQINLRDLNRALGEVVQKKILERAETSSRGFEYWLYPGAKDRIKEAEQ